VRDPANLREWALGIDPDVHVLFAPENPFGVVDHTVTLPGGDTVEVPMRVLPDGEGCEVVFTLRGDVEGDAEAVQADLERLRQVLAAPGVRPLGELRSESR
jgi:hypothetical protein